MNILSLMKNAKKMSSMMEEQQKELANITKTGEAGAGAVKIEMDCKYRAHKIIIDPEVMDDKDVLEDLVLAALNNVTEKVTEQVQGQMMDMGKMFGGGDLSGMFGKDGE